jgi:hydroxymethylglutaryl-CoA lyase
VTLVEVGPRDGLQSEEVVLPVATRVELIRRLVVGGARRIETVSFVHPRLVPQMAEAEQVMEALGPSPHGVSHIGLVLNERGLDRALATTVDEVNFVVAAAEGYSRSNQGAAVDETMASIETMIPRAREAGRDTSLTISVAFGDPYDGEVAVGDVVGLARRAAAVGVDEIALGDTIGVATPPSVKAMVGALVGAVPDVRLRCHFHDTRNTGLANMHAAWEAGVEVFDTAVGGTGGSPFAPGAGGNVATEDAVVFLDRLGVGTTYDRDLVIATGRWLGEQLGHDLPAAHQRVPPWPGP